MMNGAFIFGLGQWEFVRMKKPPNSAPPETAATRPSPVTLKTPDGGELTFSSVAVAIAFMRQNGFYDESLV